MQTFSFASKACCEYTTSTCSSHSPHPNPLFPRTPRAANFPTQCLISRTDTCCRTDRHIPLSEGKFSYNTHFCFPTEPKSQRVREREGKREKKDGSREEATKRGQPEPPSIGSRYRRQRPTASEREEKSVAFSPSPSHPSFPLFLEFPPLFTTPPLPSSSPPTGTAPARLGGAGGYGKQTEPTNNQAKRHKDGGVRPSGSAPSLAQRVRQRLIV